MIRYRSFLVGMTFWSSVSFAAVPNTVTCTVRDQSVGQERAAPAGSRGNAPVNTNAKLVTTALVIVGDTQKKHILKDSRFSVQVARYVGQIQILLTEASSRKNLVMATTSAQDFTGLDLINTTPSVTVSCVGPVAPDISDTLETPLAP